MEAKGIQVTDENFDESGPGIRVGLSLKGGTPSDLGKASWFVDPSVRLSDVLDVKFAQSPFYKQDVAGRDLHLQLPGAPVPAHFEPTSPGTVRATLPYAVPTWPGVRAAVIDLNGKPLRVAGGGTCTF